MDKCVTDGGSGAMVIVLLRNPSVELVLGDEDMRLPEPGLALLVGGGADAIYFLRGQTQKMVA